MPINYLSCKAGAEMLNDNNFCTVVALACTKQIKFSEAYDICKANGRKHGRGMMPYQITKMLGIRNEDWISCRERYGKRLTPDTFARMHPKGRYYCLTRNHAIAIVDGIVQDWTAGRRNQIIHFVKIED